MPETPALTEEARRPRLRVVAGGRREPDPAVVAVVLRDGTVRDVRAGTQDGGGGRDWASGSLAGDRWILWWERRSFD
jgi:hypothetical protein